MAGNSKRKGAIRKSGKGPLVGSGGRGKQRLEGRGPTPKAEERTKHPAAKRKRAAEKSAIKGGRAAASKRVSRPKDRDGIEWVAGRNSVLECLRAEIPASALYVQQYVETDDRLKEILLLANQQGMSLLESPRGELDRMTDGAVHQGVALRIPAYAYADPQDIYDDAIANKFQPFIVALDGVTDPRNLGAVIRSAAAFGADGVVVPERRAAGMTASAWKTSAGAASRVPVARATNLTRTLTAYRKAGCTIIGLDADGDLELSEFSASIATGPIVLVVGGEATGMSRLVRDTCDNIISIPMFDETESLNAGVAAGIALYEIARLRRP
ncbi:MAG: 23S rRNA (guanosine(2251)-2'-O)-methyltransferase RlmB [Actinobacteria bacterium]|nr:23S rRNA (guanosine(2251)-2'-O)-methyltransferase RlmB [Actinomycetota bacterium]NBY15432.1 23S rRNA (guanosine(2251)-2'-O)-methyltransferase RlmB [Actinomycetota bacterium]